MNYSITEGTVYGEPITAAEAKSAARIEITDDDSLITTYIKAARLYYEKRTRRTLTERTMTLKLDWFPMHGGPILLRRPPIQSVTSIQYVDADGVTQTWDSSNYRVALGGDMDFARVTPAYEKTYPTTRLVTGAVTVTYVAGYEADDTGSPTDYAANVPADIKNALYALVSHWYDNRSPVSDAEITAVPLFLDALISAHSIKEF